MQLLYHSNDISLRSIYLLVGETISPWDKKSIRAQLTSRAQALGLSLTKTALDYLVEAVGNDLGRMQGELNVLAACFEGEELTEALVKPLIPMLAHTNFELASAILEGRCDRLRVLLAELLLYEHPLQILGGLLYKFEIWLKYKAAIEAGVKNIK
jgi:DNA polymerase III subunit delta